MTGMPEDSQFVEKVEISKEFSIEDLKDKILDLPRFDFAKNYVGISLLTWIGFRADQSQREVRQHVLREDLQRDQQTSQAVGCPEPCSDSGAAIA